MNSHQMPKGSYLEYAAYKRGETPMLSFSEIPPPDLHRTWGPWRLDPDWYTLDHGTRNYQIDLETCTTSASTLDWIMQIQSKHWDDGSLAGLVAAFEELIHPQAHLCSFRTDKHYPRHEIRAAVDQHRRMLALRKHYRRHPHLWHKDLSDIEYMAYLRTRYTAVHFVVGDEEHTF